MNRLLAYSLAVVLTCISSLGHAAELMPPSVMSELGLTQAWARPMHVPIGAQSIASQQLFVHQQNPREYVEIVTVPAEVPAAEGSEAAAPAEGKVLVRIPTDRIGATGQEVGRKEAERLANNEIRRLKRRGVEAVINVRSVPRVHLYTVGSDGTLECRDAESGEPIWMVRVGDNRLPYSTLGVSEDFLTVINGANLIQVEAATGEVMEEVRTHGAPMFGAVNSGDFAMIPIVGGGIAGYPLYDPTRDPFFERVAGSALSVPTKSPESSKTAWGTSQGFVYVMELEGSPSVLFRLNTDGIVGGKVAAASGDRFFFGSEQGQVYGVRATRSGDVIWSQPFGEPFYHEPMVVGDQVLIRSTYGNLYALDIETGLQTWNGPVSNLGELLGTINGRVFATTLSGSLIVLDLKTGQRIGSYNHVRPSNFLVNTLTDRLYLISEGGDVQCLRMEDAKLPTFATASDAGPKQKAVQEKPKPEATTPFGPAGGGDPFGAGGNDPFGAGGGNDPFGGGGGGNDPFGGGGDAAMDDPFGGNPFGN
ncbi:MAG: PQQ-binding-like beta-propeller repeat protein [Rubripirellula sp.]